MSDLDLLAQRQRASEQAALQNQQDAPAPLDSTVTLDPIKALALEKALDNSRVQSTPPAATSIVETAKTFEQYLRGSDG
jgi:hypothetical protein